MTAVVMVTALGMAILPILLPTDPSQRVTDNLFLHIVAFVRAIMAILEQIAATVLSPFSNTTPLCCGLNDY